MGSGADYHESAVSQNLFSSSLRGGPRAGICSVCVCGSGLGMLCFVACIIIV